MTMMFYIYQFYDIDIEYLSIHYDQNRRYENSRILTDHSS